MRIDLHSGPQQISEAERNQAHSASSTASTRERAADQAQLSGAHLHTLALASQALQLPEIRESRVEALRQMLRNGQYAADPQKTAGAIVEHMTLSPVA